MFPSQEEEEEECLPVYYRHLLLLLEPLRPSGVPSSLFCPPKTPCAFCGAFESRVFSVTPGRYPVQFEFCYFSLSLFTVPASLRRGHREEGGGGGGGAELVRSTLSTDPKSIGPTATARGDGNTFPVCAFLVSWCAAAAPLQVRGRAHFPSRERSEQKRPFRRPRTVLRSQTLTRSPRFTPSNSPFYFFVHLCVYVCVRLSVRVSVLLFSIDLNDISFRHRKEEASCAHLPSHHGSSTCVVTVWRRSVSPVCSSVPWQCL